MEKALKRIADYGKTMSEVFKGGTKEREATVHLQFDASLLLNAYNRYDGSREMKDFLNGEVICLYDAAGVLKAKKVERDIDIVATVVASL